MVRTLRSAVLGYTGTSPRMCRLSSVSPRISWRFTMKTGAPRWRTSVPLRSTSGRSRNAGSRYAWLYHTATTLPLPSLTRASSTFTRRLAVSRQAHDSTRPRKVTSAPKASAATPTRRDGRLVPERQMPQQVPHRRETQSAQAPLNGLAYAAQTAQRQIEQGRVEPSFGGGGDESGPGLPRALRAGLSGDGRLLRPEGVMQAAACRLVHSWMKPRATAPGPDVGADDRTDDAVWLDRGSPGPGCRRSSARNCSRTGRLSAWDRLT